MSIPMEPEREAHNNLESIWGDKPWMLNLKDVGICRYCYRLTPLMRDKKHLRTHYIRHEDGSARRWIKMKCYGSRRIDYKNRKILLISNNLDKV